MKRATWVLLKAVVAMTVALLTVPYPMGASADTAIQNQNTALVPIARSGPAVAGNVAVVSSGPSARAGGADALAAQTGDNSMNVSQATQAESGNAYSGSQVTAPIGPTTSSESVSIQGQNDALVPLATSGTAASGTVVVADGGPIATAFTSTAAVLQNGSNDSVATIDAVARTGDALSGSQRFSGQPVASQGLPALPIGRSAQVGWILFVFLGTWVIMSLGRRPAGLVLVDQPLMSDEGLGVKLRIPDGWEGARSHHGVLSLFDPSRSPDGTAENAEVAVVCARRSTTGGDLEAFALRGPSQDPTYRHISSGYETLSDARAYRHEFEADVSGRRLRIVEYFLERPSDPDQIVRLTAYAPSDERRKIFGSLTKILQTVKAA